MTTERDTYVKVCSGTSLGRRRMVLVEHPRDARMICWTVAVSREEQTRSYDHMICVTMKRSENRGQMIERCKGVQLCLGALEINRIRDTNYRTDSDIDCWNIYSTP